MFYEKELFLKSHFQKNCQFKWGVINQIERCYVHNIFTTFSQQIIGG